MGPARACRASLNRRQLLRDFSSQQILKHSLPMIIDLPLLPDRIDTQSAGRPIRMGFFHFSNNNLSIRRQCAREIGMYDLNASKSEDVDLCFRVALDPNWVAWRANEAIVRHKGRRTLWGLIAQMWGWGLYLGYPYSKTGI